MAERALLVCERADGRCDTFGARWAGDRVDRLVGRSPRAVLAAVDPRPRKRGRRFQAVVDELDYLGTAAVYHARPTGTVAYLPLWFGLPTAGLVAEPRCGVLVPVCSDAGAGRLRRWWRALRGALADALRAGRVPPGTAPVALLAALADRPTVRPTALATRR